MKTTERLRRQLRRWRDRRMPTILLYHRVARQDCDPWGLAVRPDLFADQIEALARRRTVVPLERLADELERGHAPQDWVAITFDDGYADVLHEACPVLQRHGCAATLFVTTDMLDSAGFWWDRLARAILTPERLPGELVLEDGAAPFRWAAEKDGSDRSALHLAIWRWLRRRDPDRREALLDAIEVWAGPAPPRRDGDRALTTAELRELADSGVFSIGAHSLSHAPLPELTREAKAAEIAGSRRRCEEILGRKVDTFAYPYGELDEEACEEARRAGFRLACSTVKGPVRPDSPRYALPRTTVKSWSGAQLLSRLPWGG